MSTLSTSPSDIDSDNPSNTFNHGEWIGVRRKLPKNPNLILMGLTNLFALLLEDPGHVKAAYYPPPNLDVSHFIVFLLPVQTHSLPKIHIVECFLSSVPNEHDEDTFLTHWLPPRHFVDELLHWFCQAVLDGMKVIVHPAFPGSYLPLWCIQFWKDMWSIYEKKGEWKNAAECLWVLQFLPSSLLLCKFVLSMDGTHIVVPSLVLFLTHIQFMFRFSARNNTGLKSP